LGITFKENCPDVRNTKIVDVIAALKDYSVNVTVHDPWANPAEVLHEYGIECKSELHKISKFDAIVLGVAHEEFLNLDLKSYLNDTAIIYDVKGILEYSDCKL